MIVAIINQQGHNFGDEAAGCALTKELIKNKNIDKVHIFYASDSEIPIYDDKVEHHLDLTLKKIGFLNLFLFMLRSNKQEHNYNSVLNKINSILKKCDIVFVSPCGASIGIYRDWRYILRLYICLKDGKRPIFHFNTIGDSGDFIFNAIAKKILKRSDIYVREEASKKYLYSIGINSELGPDTAFLLDKTLSQNFNEISFVPAHLDDWHPFFKKNGVDYAIENDFIPSLAKYLIDNSLKIKILPHFNLKSELDYCYKIKKIFLASGMDEGSVRVCENIDNYIDYDLEIANSKLVIGMRYHASVLSAKNAVPFISLAYENKMIEVSKYMNMEEFYVDLSLFYNDKNLPQTIIEKVDNALKNTDIISKNLERRSALMKEKARFIIDKYC